VSQQSSLAQGSFGISKCLLHLLSPHHGCSGLQTTLQRVREWPQNFGRRRHKTAVKINHPKESLQLLHRRRLGMVLHCGHPVWKWPNPLLCHMMTKELDFPHCKLTLLTIDDQSSSSETAENLLHILLVLLQGLAGHNDVIKVDEHEGKTGQNPVHHPLEGTSSIPQAKWKAQKLKEAKRGDDGRLRNVIWMHKNLKITFSQINL
jgi:hypothetical protein